MLLQAVFFRHSSFKGKVTALKLMQGTAFYTETFLELGSKWDVPDTLKTKLEKFVCTLYGQSSTEFVDLARYNWLRQGSNSD